MKRVSRSEILELGAYEEIRDNFRARIIRDKRTRRVALGPHMTVLFENHDTVLFQIQEMLRTERISAEPAILHELETYNELVPGRDELSATIFIEYTDRDERERMLAKLAGIEQCFYVSGGETRCSALTHNRGERSDRTTAVHYVKFPLDAAARGCLSSPDGKLYIGVDHAAYRTEVQLGEDTKRALQADLLAWPDGP